MSQRVFYRLADLVIRAQFDFEFYAEISYMKEFIISEQENYEYEIIFQQVNNINAWIEKAGRCVNDYGPYQFYLNEEGEEYCFFKHGQYLHAVTFLKEKKVYCYYVSKQWMREITAHGFALENFFQLEKILMDSFSMVLHSCHIQKVGNAILFSAPSGTGKSTQGELWRKYANAEVINGDRTIIRRVKHHWNAYGTPFCGTSGIGLNKEAPLKAIIVLRQSVENKCRILHGREAFYSIYSEITVHTWDVKYVDKALEWVSELIEEIPVILFECTKEPDAVDVLNSFMKMNHII